MSTIPTNLSTEQAEEITEVLLLAKRYLADAASPSPIYSPSYASTAQKIESLLRDLNVDMS